MVVAKHIVLTGASGYLGQHILHSFLTNPPPPDHVYKITALYHKCPGFVEAVQRVSYASGIQVNAVSSLNLMDAMQIQEWKASLLDDPIDICIHTAAVSSPRACEVDPVSISDIYTCLKTFDTCLETSVTSKRKLSHDRYDSRLMVLTHGVEFLYEV